MHSQYYSTLLALALIGGGCQPEERWYKGNTHTHTLLCGHADTSPEAVTQWYHERDYHFLCLSEHNQFIDPASVKMPDGKREDFILIPGEEITGGLMAHTTALNIDGLVDPRLQQPVGASKSGVIQAHVHGTEKVNGRAILNHPNFHYMHTAADIRPVKGLHMLELYNGHPSVNNFGDENHVSVERLWDQLLSDGMLIYGVSSDDAHQFQKLGPKHSNPGRGWVMVRASALTADAITEAMYRGDFYATSGVILSRAESTGHRISVTVNERATTEELSSSYVMGHRAKVGEIGYLIELIGQGGEVLQSVSGTNASFAMPEESSYARVKVTYAREVDAEYEKFTHGCSPYSPMDAIIMPETQSWILAWPC